MKTTCGYWIWFSGVSTITKDLRISVFLEVSMIIKELNQIFGIYKVCQSVVIKSSSFKVHLKPYEEYYNSILQRARGFVSN